MSIDRPNVAVILTSHVHQIFISKNYNHTARVRVWVIASELESFLWQSWLSFGSCMVLLNALSHLSVVCLFFRLVAALSGLVSRNEGILAIDVSVGDWQHFLRG